MTVTGPLERDTCREIIVPALHDAGWDDDRIRSEQVVDARKILTLGDVSRDLDDGRVDYVLEAAGGLPVAVIEAKRAYARAAQGLRQAVRYGEMLDVPVVYASNGSETIEKNLRLGTERSPSHSRPNAG